MVFETGLPTRYYINQTEINSEHLTPSDTVTACPYKGSTSPLRAWLPSTTKRSTSSSPATSSNARTHTSSHRPAARTPVLVCPARGRIDQRRRPERRFVIAVRVTIGHVPGALAACAPPDRWVGPGGVCWWTVGYLPRGSGKVGGDDVGGVPVEAAAGPVVAHRRAWVGVGGGFLHVAKRDSGVEGGGDERVAQRVRPDRFGDPGAAGYPAQ